MNGARNRGDRLVDDRDEQGAHDGPAIRTSPDRSRAASYDERLRAARSGPKNREAGTGRRRFRNRSRTQAGPS